jgi:hypothetical protein
VRPGLELSRLHRNIGHRARRRVPADVIPGVLPGIHHDPQIEVDMKESDDQRWLVAWPHIDAKTV